MIIFIIFRNYTFNKFVKEIDIEILDTFINFVLFDYIFKSWLLELGQILGALKELNKDYFDNLAD